MQNYQNFIDELFRLNIGTVRYFVKDGQVLYHEQPVCYTDAELATIPAERLPGHVGTFMSLDQYDEHRKENRYADTLAELQKQAVTELLSFEPAQINRHMVRAKQECEVLSRLVKKAGEYENAWLFSTLDQLPSLFLETRIFSVLTVKNRPEASPHLLFAHHLTDAISCKRGILSGFIEQIEAVPQTAPAVIADATQEPEYDASRLKGSYEKDPDYFFEKLPAFKRHLDGLTDYQEKVMYWIRMSAAMGFDPLFGDRNFSRNGPVILWGVNSTNKRERAIKRKMWFLYFYRDHINYAPQIPRHDFEQLLNDYLKLPQTERTKRIQLEWVTDEIYDVQARFNVWVRDNRKHTRVEVFQETQNAAVLIERDLEGIPAIKWHLFIPTDEFGPLAALWGLVEYKRFLETDETPGPATPTPPPPATAIQPGFDTCILEEHRARLMPYLTVKYANKTARFYVPMLYALENLGYLTERIDTYDLTDLHKSLAVTLGSIGKYSGFHNAIKLYDSETIQPAKQQKIRGIQIEIDKVLKQG